MWQLLAVPKVEAALTASAAFPRRDQMLYFKEINKNLINLRALSLLKGLKCFHSFNQLQLHHSLPNLLFWGWAAKLELGPRPYVHKKMQTQFPGMCWCGLFCKALCARVPSHFSLFPVLQSCLEVILCFDVSSQGLWCWSRQGLIGDYCQICFHPCNLSASKHDVGLSTDYIPGLWKATKGKKLHV